MILNLLDNSLDYIYEGVRPLYLSHNYSQVSLKYSVLHVYSGIQLLLKERLKQEHWSLIFQDVNIANQNRLEAGDFVSVYHDELIKRLRNLSGIEINDEPISSLRDLRNRFENFEINISVDECKKTLAAALEVTIEFWVNHLSQKATKNQNKKFMQIKSIIMGHEVYVSHRLERFEKAIASIKSSKNGLIVCCPTCGSSSFAVFKNQSKECKCFVCDTFFSKEAYLAHVRDYERSQEEFSFVPYEPYDSNCSFCNNNSRIRNQLSDDLTLFFCIECLHEETVSKQELQEIELNQWVVDLKKNHSNNEVIEILEKR